MSAPIRPHHREAGKRWALGTREGMLHEEIAQLLADTEAAAKQCEHERCYSEQTMAAVVKERDALRAEHAALVRALRRLVGWAEALHLLCACYRTGRHPREKTLQTLGVLAGADENALIALSLPLARLVEDEKN